MKKSMLYAVALILIVISPTAPAQQGDQRIVAAREALRSGDQAKLEQLAAAADPDHLLDHYVEYWLLVNRLARTEPPPTRQIGDFITRHAGRLPADRLQAYWLRRLARDADWGAYLRVFADHAAPDAELRCLAWQARQATGEQRVLAEIASQWRALIDTHDACAPLLQASAANGHVSSDDVWWRFRRQIDSRNPSAAQTTTGWLPAAEAPSLRDLEQVISSPAQFVDRMPPNFAVTRAGRELALAALTRLSRSDALAAYTRFARLLDRFEHDERSYMYAVLGHHGAQSRLPQADDWFRAAGDVAMTPAQREWRVRAALRIENWPRVQSTIEALNDDERHAPEWIYWLARARAAQGHPAEAESLYRQIAPASHFYGLLAAEELGRLFSPPPPDDTIDGRDQARASADAGLQRALAFYRLGMITEGVREWFGAVRDRDRGFLLAAAHLALENNLYDRAINTAELADAGANYALRFIAPFRELVEPQVIEQGLDLAWVYGLMRQESRFVVPARSSAGAQGLMQVMPATGEWVANRIGLTAFSARMLNDPSTNVLLGTSYMRLILGDLDNHPVLASAGYNAGPARARRWRADKPIEAAIYIETIPFDETRDYVKKVLANAVVYGALFDNRPQSLKARLGVIAPAPID